MADKTPEKETEETEETKKPVGLVVPLIIVMVLMPIVAYLTTKFFLADELARTIADKLDGVEIIEPSEDGEDKNTPEPKKDKDGNLIPTKDFFLMERQQVNVKNTNGSRSLFFSYLIVGKESGGLGTRIEESKKFQAKCREEAGYIVGQFELSEMDGTLTKSKAKTQMITAFNDIFEDDPVEDVVLEAWSVN